MWNVAIFLACVVIGDFQYNGEVAAGLLPNGKYVIITPHVNFLFDVKGQAAEYHLLEDEQGDLYGLKVVHTDKEITLLLIKYKVVKRKKVYDDFSLRLKQGLCDKTNTTIELPEK